MSAQPHLKFSGFYLELLLNRIEYILHNGMTSTFTCVASVYVFDFFCSFYFIIFPSCGKNEVESVNKNNRR